MNFKACPKCGTLWSARADLLCDPQIRFLGYQSGPHAFDKGFFLFNHLLCGTSLALELPSVESLVQIPVLGLSGCATGAAPASCLHESGDTLCPLYCVCAFVQAVRAVIEGWPKPHLARSGS
jgi:hypothetical protein